MISWLDISLRVKHCFVDNKLKKKTHKVLIKIY